MSLFSRKKPVFQSHRRLKSGSSGQLEHLVIFLGHHKVGSTSLQDYLARNAFNHARQGVLYPFVDFEGAAFFAAAGCGTPAPDKLPLNIREPHNALAFAMLANRKDRAIPEFHRSLPSLDQMHHALTQQIKQLRPHTVVLASEVFANFGAAGPEFAQDLSERFQAKSVTLYACFRPIEPYLISWHGQRLKFGHKIAPLRDDAVTAYSESIHFDYRKVLNGWQKAFPNAKVVLRNYSEVNQAGGLVADFFAQSQLPAVSELSQKRLNRSLHPALFEILRRAIFELEPQMVAPLRKGLVRLTRRLELPPPREIEMLGPVQRQRVLGEFETIDVELGRLVGRDRFFGEAPLGSPLVSEHEANRLALASISQNLDVWDQSDIKDFLTSLCLEFDPKADG